ncbi:MAG: tyrosine-type recombinase/integrase [Bryobacteraceae bacterium]|nr:tyrosine-type recombinase/integrase [Bryobacteraceae bacterium]
MRRTTSPDPRARLVTRPTFAEPFQGERMARREFQRPEVLKHEGPRPYWYVRYRVKTLTGPHQVARKEKRQWLGNCDEMTKRQAERLRDEIMRKVNDQVFTIQNQIPFGEFVKLYLDQHVSTLAPGPKQKYTSLLKNHILPEFGEKRLCDVRTDVVQVFLNRKAAGGLAWWTRNDLKGVISGIYTKASDWGYWSDKNPVLRTTLGRKRAKRLKLILSDEQFARLLNELREDVRLMVETAISTGMRVSEIIGLKWRCVDLDRGLIRVEERYYRGDTDEPKSERSHRILSLGVLLEDYRSWKPGTAGPDDYVFHRAGKPMDDRQLLRNELRPAAKRLDIHFPGFGWHTFRRQNLTLIQEEGASPFEAQAQAGYSKPVMTSAYTLVGLDRREKAVRKVQLRLLKKTG